MQADIDDMKIIYMPPFNDMGQEDKYFSFKFTGIVENGIVNFIPYNTLFIYLYSWLITPLKKRC